MIKYFKNVNREFKKIRWITAGKMFKDFRFVLIMSIFFVAFFAALDFLITTIV